MTEPAPVCRPAFWTGTVFLCALSVYWLSPVRTAFDSRWSVHTAMSLLRGDLGRLDAYRPLLEAQDYYAIDRNASSLRTVYPIGVSLLVAPAVLVQTALDSGFEPRLRTGIPARFEQHVASIIGAVAAALFFRLLLSEFGSTTTALLGTTAFALGTTMWSDATRALWQHGPLVLCLVAAMALLRRGLARPDLVPYAGAALACAYLMRPTAAIPILVLSAYVVLRHRAQSVRFLLWAMPIALPWLALNWVTLHQFLPDYYLVASAAGPNPPNFPLEGLLGVLFSPGRGLLIYSPFLALAGWGFVLAIRDRTARPLFVAFGLIAIASLALAAQWGNWWGGHSYGPRLLTDVAPLLAFFAAFALDAVLRRAAPLPRAAVGVLVLLSITMQAPGALSQRSWVWNVEPANVDTNTLRLWDWRDPPFLRFAH